MKRNQPLEVVAALLEKDGKVLICQRPAGKARAHQWEFPGGKIEPGETPDQALQRECREELGADITANSPAADIVFDYPDVRVHLTLIRARVTGRGPQALEHEALCWVDYHDLLAFDLCPADRRLVEALFS
ncbi:MAG: (deoxy)nucleoside triphosphate pyrophosphohydrolase [Clostridia bacterium]|nr:(deoxy)nucleoside triphosphate pyrophosphohydrolase [Clostridia bacterium]